MFVLFLCSSHLVFLSLTISRTLSPTHFLLLKFAHCYYHHPCPRPRPRPRPCPCPCVSVALEAFGRCVQQDMEIGEAWANIGAIHMKQRAYKHALSALKVSGADSGRGFEWAGSDGGRGNKKRR